MLLRQIICNACGTVGMLLPNKHAHVMRKELREFGWTCIEAGGKDYCPRCSKPVAQEEQSGHKITAEEEVMRLGWG